MANAAGRRRAGRAQVVAAVVALVLGAGLVAYPYVSDYLNKLNQAEAISQQADAVDGTSSEALQRELEASLSYNERLRNSLVQVTDPFDPAVEPVTDEEYEARLNLAGDGVMGSIVVPAIDATVPIYHGTSDDALQHGAGHLQATSLPVGGASSHCVIAGHNGLPSVRIFDDLHKLEVGDYFVVRILGEEHAYRVYGIETVKPEDTGSLVIEDGRDLMTLITCTPYGVNTHRLLVHAERYELPKEWLERDRDRADEVGSDPGRLLLPFTIAGAAIAAGIVAARVVARRHRGGGGPGAGPRGPQGRAGGAGGSGRVARAGRTGRAPGAHVASTGRAARAPGARPSGPVPSAPPTPDGSGTRGAQGVQPIVPAYQRPSQRERSPRRGKR